MNCRGSRFDGWLGTVGPETPPTRYRLVFLDRLCSRGGQFPVGFRMPKDRTAKSNRSRVVDVVDVAKAFLWYLTPFGRLHPRETLVSVAKLQGFETTIKYPRHQANGVRGPAHIKQPKAIGQSLPATSQDQFICHFCHTLPPWLETSNTAPFDGPQHRCFNGILL